TELVEESQAVEPAAYQRLLELLERRLPQAEMLVLSGSLPQEAPEAFYGWCVAAARRHGVPAIVDSRGGPLREALRHQPALVKHNVAELAETVQAPVETESQRWDAIRRLMDSGAQQVVVTRGPDPVLTADGERMGRVVVPPVPVVSAIGCGDALGAG